jgi:hypothetical protein
VPGSLPTDPPALRAALELAASRYTKAGGSFWDGGIVTYASPHSAAIRRIIFFQLVNRLLMAPISGPLRASLYQAIAGLPGVRLIPHVKDAAGRSGTEVQIPVPGSRVPSSDKGAWQRGTGIGYGPDVQGFILDPRTYRYLGSLGTFTMVFATGPDSSKVLIERDSSTTALVKSGFVTPRHG